MSWLAITTHAAAFLAGLAVAFGVWLLLVLRNADRHRMPWL